MSSDGCVDFGDRDVRPSKNETTAMARKIVKIVIGAMVAIPLAKVSVLVVLSITCAMRQPVEEKTGTVFWRGKRRGKRGQSVQVLTPIAFTDKMGPKSVFHC